MVIGNREDYHTEAETQRLDYRVYGKIESEAISPLVKVIKLV